MDPPSCCAFPQNDDAPRRAETMGTKSERGSCRPPMEDAPSCASFPQNAPSSCAAMSGSSSNTTILFTICEVITLFCALGKIVISNLDKMKRDDTQPRNTRDRDEEAPVFERRRKKAELEEEKSQEEKRMALNLEREKLELQRKAEERQAQQLEMQMRAEEERILAIDLDKCPTEALRTYYAALQQQILVRVNSKHGI